jgi:hypothetical protein
MLQGSINDTYPVGLMPPAKAEGAKALSCPQRWNVLLPRSIPRIAISMMASVRLNRLA